MVEKKDKFIRKQIQKKWIFLLLIPKKKYLKKKGNPPGNQKKIKKGAPKDFLGQAPAQCSSISACAPGKPTKREKRIWNGATENQKRNEKGKRGLREVDICFTKFGLNSKRNQYLAIS